MDNEEILENCPHCGTKLSPWQKVLLKVDRAIVCKNCWYRIILTSKSLEVTKEKSQETKEKKETRRKNDNI